MKERGIKHHTHNKTREAMQRQSHVTSHKKTDAQPVSKQRLPLQKEEGQGWETDKA